MTNEQRRVQHPTAFEYRNIPKTFDMSAYTPKTNKLPNTLPTTNIPGYDMSNQMYDIPGQFKR